MFPRVPCPVPFQRRSRDEPYSSELALVVALTMSGCYTTLGELRQTASVRREIVGGDYRAVALCTVDGANSLPRGFILVHTGNIT